MLYDCARSLITDVLPTGDVVFSQDLTELRIIRQLQDIHAMHTQPTPISRVRYSLTPLIIIGNH